MIRKMTKIMALTLAGVILSTNCLSVDYIMAKGANDSQNVISDGNISDASEYTVSDISGLHYFDSYDLINVEGNKLKIVRTDDEYKKRYNKIIWTTISNDGSVKRNNFICDNKTYGKKMENNRIYTSTYNLKNNTLNIQVRNKKGKIKNTYMVTKNNKVTKKLKYLNVNPITIKGNKMYYVLIAFDKKNKHCEYAQCYDMKKKKIISSKKMSTQMYYFYDNNNLYGFAWENNVLTKYSLKGEKLTSYTMPEGETSVTINNLYGFSHTQEKGLQACDVNGRYIYYCNRNGLYRCDTEGDGIFELIYDGSNDREVFNPAMYEEKILMKFCVLEDESFCIATCDQNGTPGRRYMYKKQ